MNRNQWLDLHNETPHSRHASILDAAYREHRADICPKCGATWPAVVGTLYGYQVVCTECDTIIEEVEL